MDRETEGRTYAGVHGEPGFSAHFDPGAFDRLGRRIADIENGSTSGRVRSILSELRNRQPLREDDFLVLLSRAADPYLEEMAVLAREITMQRFGRTVLLYAPLYLSNVCYSTCTYCGFAYGHNIRRRTLTIDEAVADADVLHRQGIRHILLLTGEAYRDTPVSYIGEAASALSSRFPSIGIEVYPLKEKDYSMLREKGVDGLTVYQETYDPLRYAQVHPKGMKSLMNWRLDAPDRGGRAGLRRLSIGALLGLSDATTEVAALGLHARYLLRNYWQSSLSVSLPRLRPATEVHELPTVPDRDYVRYWLALRLFLPDAGLVLSSRETASFRDRMMGICITQVSAGARTEPGGYSGSEATEQFHRSDERSVADMAAAVAACGKEPVFTDWAPVLK